MTDRDVLKRASEALRETSEPSAAELARLRQRVLKGKPQPSGRPVKSKTLRWVLPLAAAFIAGSAFAATPGAWEGMLSSVERFLDVRLLPPAQHSAHVPRQKRTPAARPAPLQPLQPAPSDEPGVRTAEQVSADAAQPAPAEAASPTAVSASQPVAKARPSVTPSLDSSLAHGTARLDPRPHEPEEAPAAAEAVPHEPEPRGPSRDLTLYNAAHELHFRARRYDEALRAWETYLALSPAPTFALEARYNRAVCLVRLGHYEEARAALKPFAEGRLLGGYRREEAARFIQVLDKRR